MTSSARTYDPARRMGAVGERVLDVLRARKDVFRDQYRPAAARELVEQMIGFALDEPIDVLPPAIVKKLKADMVARSVIIFEVVDRTGTESAVREAMKLFDLTRTRVFQILAKHRSSLLEWRSSLNAEGAGAVQ